MSPLECIDNSTRLLQEAELQAIDNPTRAEMLSSLAAEWRALGELLVSMIRDG